MNQKKVTEYEELSIESVTGLQAFLRNAQSQYQIGLKKEADFLAQGNQTYGDELQHAFQTVRHTTNKLINRVQEGTGVNKNDATNLQSDYDELVRVVNQKKTDSKPLNKQEDKQKPKQKPVPKQTHKLNQTNKPKPPVKKKPVINDIAKSEKTNELKPKTGALSINSDDTEVLDVKNRVSVADSALVNSTPSSAKVVKKKVKTSLSPASVKSAGKEIAKLKLVIAKSQRRFGNLQQQYENPNLAQELLFEEAREGIEHLELLAKKPAFKKEQLLSISEVATHVKYALDSIVEADDKGSSDKDDKNVPVVTKQVTKSKPVSFVPTSVTTQKTGVVKRSIPKQLQTLPKPEEEFGRESLTKLYLTGHRHLQFLQQHYSSPTGFEQILDATVTKIEAETIDSIEKWLGDIPASAFSFLKDMKISEIESFSNRSFEEVTYDLQQQNIKYETFVVWRDMIGEMLEVVPEGESMVFGELFANWMIELAMQEVEQQ